MVTSHGYGSFSASLPTFQDSIVPWGPHCWLEGTDTLGKNCSPSEFCCVYIYLKPQIKLEVEFFLLTSPQRFSRTKAQGLKTKKKKKKRPTESCVSQRTGSMMWGCSVPAQRDKPNWVLEGHLYLLALSWPVWNESLFSAMGQVNGGPSRNNSLFLSIALSAWGILVSIFLQAQLPSTICLQILHPNQQQNYGNLQEGIFKFRSSPAVSGICQTVKQFVNYCH